MTTPERSVEEIVKDEADSIMHHAESFIADYSNKDWFRARVENSIKTTLKAERQKREEVVREEREKMNDCTCKEKWTFGVVHRKDKPCYLAPQQP